MTCMCGDTQCPSCGLAQGTLDERDLAVDFLRRHGYRRCDIPACNCGSWHGGHANARLNELREAFEQDEHTNTNGKTLLNLVCETLSERDALRESAKAAEELLLDVQLRTSVVDDEIDAYFAKYAMLTERAVEVPCPACPDGNRWTREGPAGRCKVCNGTGILPARAVLHIPVGEEE